MSVKILVVEDDAATQQLLEFLLKKEGYEVISSTDGKDAFDKATREKPDLVITDIMLPHTDGLELTKNLKKEDGLKQIPIIIVSSLGQEMEVTQGLRSGADGYIVKPFHPQQLFAALKKVFKK